MFKTIKSNSKISELFRIGKLKQTKDILIYYKLSDNLDEGKVAFIAGKKLGKAPTRNYLKRRLRHLYLLNKDKFNDKQILLIAKKSLIKADFWKVNKDLEKISFKNGTN